MPRFRLRTLLILIAMLALLLATWPWMIVNPYHFVPGSPHWIFTDLFKAVATAEVIILVGWAGLAWNRRRLSTKPDSN